MLRTGAVLGRWLGWAEIDNVKIRSGCGQDLMFGPEAENMYHSLTQAPINTLP
jgi:hypothetical protein